MYYHKVLEKHLASKDVSKSILKSASLLDLIELAKKLPKLSSKFFAQVYTSDFYLKYCKAPIELACLHYGLRFAHFNNIIIISCVAKVLWKLHYHK